MASPIPLQLEYGGICRDYPRDQLPPGYIWECIDFVPQILSAPLTKRGGFKYGSTAMGATSSVKGLLYAPFASGVLNLAITSDNHLYSFTSGSNSDLGAAVNVVQNPVFHRSSSTGASPDAGLAIIPAAGGSTAPKSYDGSTLQNLAGTPPKATYACVFNDYTVFGNGTVGSTAYTNRIWFSVRGDAAAAWDTTNSVQDSTAPITGLAAARSAILVFHSRFTERFRGTHPGTAAAGDASDFAQDTPLNVGCMDARTIVNYKDGWVLWADQAGIYMSDGVSIKNIAAEGLISSIWRVYTAQAWTVAAAGIINDTYFISLTGSGGTDLGTWAYDIVHGWWWRAANFKFLCYARSGGATEETYAGMAGAGRVAALSTVFTPSGTYKNDAEGSAVIPYMETGFYRGFQRLHRKWVPSMGIQSWKCLYLNYVLQDAASDSPTIQIQCMVNQDGTFAAPTNTLAAHGSTQIRTRRDLRLQANAIAFNFQQANASAQTKLYMIEGWYEPLGTGQLSQ